MVQRFEKFGLNIVNGSAKFAVFKGWSVDWHCPAIQIFKQHSSLNEICLKILSCDVFVQL